TDRTALVWNTGKPAEPTNAVGPVPALSPDELWKALASDNASEAYRAMHTLRASPREAAELVGKRRRPVPDPENQINRILNLYLPRPDDDDYYWGEQASKQLLDLGGRAGPALKEALRTSPSVEVNHRINNIPAALERIPEKKRAGDLADKFL